MPMARAPHHSLLYSTLICILPAAILTGAIAAITGRLLMLGAGYPVKALTAFSFGMALLLRGLQRYHPFQVFGPANQVTVVRLSLLTVLVGLIGERADTGAALVATAVAVIIVVLDGLDGWLARRTRMASTLGARFDMETDAALIMVLAVLAWQYDKAGVWVLLSGLLRYAFVGAAIGLPSLRRPLPPSGRRKLVAVVQMIALVIAVAPIVPAAATVPVTFVGLCALTVSFAADIAWLLHKPALADTPVSAQ